MFDLRISWETDGLAGEGKSRPIAIPRPRVIKGRILWINRMIVAKKSRCRGCRRDNGEHRRKGRIGVMCLQWNEWMCRLKMVDKVLAKIRRMSLNQLGALKVLLDNGVVEADEVKIGLEGKALGGVFSSLSRQRIGGESLVEPWGRGEGRGLRWKLNEKVIDKSELKEFINRVLNV